MPSAPIKVPQSDKGEITFSQLDKPTQDRIVRNEIVVYTVLGVAVLTVVGVLIGAYALVLDQLHFNNQLYRDGGYTHTVVEQQTVQEQPITVKFPNLKPYH